MSIVQLANPITDFERCPHCGCFKPTLHLEHAYVDARAGTGRGLGWAAYRCSGCYGLVAFEAPMTIANDVAEYSRQFHQDRVYALRVFPEFGAKLSGLPPRAGTYLQQALEAINAPDGAVMLAGSAVDAMLKAKGYSDGSVFTRIEKAVENHLLTPAMGEWAHAVRLQANQPRHADDDDPHATTAEARQVIEFARALGDFLFVLPARIEEGKRAAQSHPENQPTTA